MTISCSLPNSIPCTSRESSQIFTKGHAPAIPFTGNVQKRRMNLSSAVAWGWDGKDPGKDPGKCGWRILFRAVTVCSKQVASCVNTKPLNHTLYTVNSVNYGS